MDSTTSINWSVFNQEYLTNSLAEVRHILKKHLNGPLIPLDKQGEIPPDAKVKARETPASSALETLCEEFNLSPFERHLLVLCVGIELDTEFASLCAAIQEDSTHPHPTFSLALATLPQPHWSALSPASPLRYWRLLEVGEGSSLTQSPLRIDERVLHYLTDIPGLDERLKGYLEIVRNEEELAPSHQKLASRIVAIWSQHTGSSFMPVVEFSGQDRDAHRAIAAAACASLGLNLYISSAQVIPTEPRELDALKRLWERESILNRGSLCLDCQDLDPSDKARSHAVHHLVESLRCPLIIANSSTELSATRPVVTLEVLRPTISEQRDLWEESLGRSMNGQAEALISQFNLSTHAIRAVSAEAQVYALYEGLSEENVEDLDTWLWNACRRQSKPRLEKLAQYIQPIPQWDDLVLPDPQKMLLREISMHVKKRGMVYETWGFAAKSSRGLGISALFAGVSGTGKTMAAEVLANDLALDLYRIDLSQVVSKYIGETEKNLSKIFDAAEGGGAILLFDEADALFGKRSEVKDSHDRYANIEISYLLQRMETYRGLAILTTNMKNALDTAFMRRIRFVVRFPFPNITQREEIWRRIFPKDTPTNGLDEEKLAQLNVAGGNIRNIALYAAFLAAEAGESVSMSHLLRAAHTEYGKLEKSLTETETKNWIQPIAGIQDER